MAEIDPLAKTYQKGHRQVFSLESVGGALPSTSTKQVDKWKQKMTEEEIHAEIGHEEEEQIGRASCRESFKVIKMTKYKRVKYGKTH